MNWIKKLSISISILEMLSNNRWSKKLYANLKLKESILLNNLFARYQPKQQTSQSPNNKSGSGFGYQKKGFRNSEIQNEDLNNAYSQQTDRQEKYEKLFI